jgi:DNA anti-recombination protein RmuC
MGRLELRISNLDKHFSLASKDVDEIKVSAKKANRRVFNIERFEFDEFSKIDVGSSDVAVDSKNENNLKKNNDI